MFDRLKPLIATFALAIVAFACTPTAAVPTVAPTVAPTTAPTPVATTAPTDAPIVVATEAPTAGDESVLDFEQIGVEKLASVFIDNGWFADREDSTLDTGAQLILLQSVKSKVSLGIVHDGNTLLRVTVYDGDLFASDDATNDLGIVNGLLLNKTLGSEAVTWQSSLTAAVGDGIEESRVFGPHKVIVDAGTDPDHPKDVFVFFEDAE